jgi:hypothetical protein
VLFDSHAPWDGHKVEKDKRESKNEERMKKYI